MLAARFPLYGEGKASEDGVAELRRGQIRCRPGCPSRVASLPPGKAGHSTAVNGRNEDFTSRCS